MGRALLCGPAGVPLEEQASSINHRPSRARLLNGHFILCLQYFVRDLLLLSVVLGGGVKAAQAFMCSPAPEGGCGRDGEEIPKHTQSTQGRRCLFAEGYCHVCCVSNFVGAFRSPAGCMMGITDWKSKSGRHKFERSSQAAFLMQNPQHQRTGAEVVLHKLHLSLSLSTGGKWISASSVLGWESCRYFLEIQCLRPLG